MKLDRRSDRPPPLPLEAHKCLLLLMAMVAGAVMTSTAADSFFLLCRRRKDLRLGPSPFLVVLVVKSFRTVGSVPLAGLQVPHLGPLILMRESAALMADRASWPKMFGAHENYDNSRRSCCISFTRVVHLPYYHTPSVWEGRSPRTFSLLATSNNFLWQYTLCQHVNVWKEWRRAGAEANGDIGIHSMSAI